jgi:polysaccharide export outer membrane protein
LKRIFIKLFVAIFLLYTSNNIRLYSDTTNNSDILDYNNSNSTDKENYYYLAIRDRVKILVYGQDDLTIEQHIDQDGLIQIPLLGPTKIGGMTVRDAERFVAKKFITEEYLRNPQVAISILEYAPREVSVFGQVNSPGQIIFPPELRFMDIEEVISRAGDFSNVAKSDEVRITRKIKNGEEKIFTCNVEKIITGKSRNKNDRESFKIYPGDVIYVPERFF